MYETIKHAHIFFVVISILLFEYRFLLKVINKPTSKLLSILPHINDTLLLIAGVSLAFIANLNPFDHPWLTAKIIALLFYIGFGMTALKSSGVKSLLGYTFATLAIVFIVFTAIGKSPLFFNLI